MFLTPTTFVVGAGASCELGLPSGIGLKKRLSAVLNLRYAEFSERPESGEFAIAQAMAEFINTEAKNLNFNHLRQRSVQIAENVSLARSIDHYLHVFNHDAELTLCGKIGIAWCLLEAERLSHLKVSNRDEAPVLTLGVETWYEKFWDMLTTGVARNQIGHIFDNVSFVVFNYDRCIEHFIFHSLQRYYQLPADRAAALMKRLRIFHVYGTVGPLPWQIEQPRNGIMFGQDLFGAALLRASRNLRTFTEQIEEGTLLDAVRKEFLWANNVVFLGCAFHDQNMQLLKGTSGTPVERVFATAFKLSEDEREISRELALKTFGLDTNAYLRFENTTCDILLYNYGRRISS